jgi:hypothetical protein
VRAFAWILLSILIWATVVLNYQLSCLADRANTFCQKMERLNDR